MSFSGTGVRERRRLDGEVRQAVGQVFGLEVEAPAAVPLAPPSPGGGSDRRTTVRLTSVEVVKRRWRPTEPVSLLERRYDDGRLSMTVDYDSDCGYLIYAPWYGRYLVSPDGRSILSTMPNVPLWRWLIVLYAQALPLASTLQGLELLHASGVVVDGRLLAFSAPSGTGKTSVAAHLVANGATLLTDDVLAVERSGTRIVAHPGAPLSKVSTGELATMPREGRARLGTRIGRNDKVLLLTRLPAQPQPLDGVYFLRRWPIFKRLTIEPLDPDPFRLLAHSFNTYVRSHDRVVNQLAVHASIVDSVGLYSVSVPPSAPASEVARAVRAHVERG